MRASLLSIILLPFALSAQTTFAPIGAAWSYTQHYAFAPDSALLTVRCVGDTLIDGDLCSVLDHSGGVVACMGFSAIVRTAGDTVFWQDSLDGVFQVLYVIGLPPGQGWKTAAGRPEWDQEGNELVVHDTLTFTVTASDVVTIGGQALRRSTVYATYDADVPFLHVPFSGMVIERLGHSVFLFPWIDAACDGEYNGPLRCYADSDIDWLDPHFPQCDLVTGIAEQDDADISVRPTLVRRDEPVFVQATLGGTAAVRVIDASGRIVLSRPVPGDGTTLYIGQAGTYTVVMDDGARRSVTRVVVQD